MRTVLTIDFDGERVAGQLHDETGKTTAFSGWLDLIAALQGLAERPAALTVED